MPPLQGCKFLLILAVTRSFPSLSGELIINDEILVVGFLDVKRAHCAALARREVHVELPPELQKMYGSGVVARLLRSLYGTRDASTNWEFTIREVLVEGLGFLQGLASPCHYWHGERQLRVSVHGDDFTTLGTLINVQWFHAELEKRWLVEIRGILGHPGLPGTVQEMWHLNRLIT